MATVTRKKTACKKTCKTTAKKTHSTPKTTKINIPKEYHFKKILQQLVKDFDGIDIFSEENALRLNKALNRLDKKFSIERETLLIANKCNISQRLYAVISNPQADKTNTLKECEKDLLSNGIADDTCKDLLSNISVILYQSDLTILEKRQAKTIILENKTNFKKPRNAKAYIARIDSIEPIPNADLLELANVSGINVVVEKKHYSVGEVVVYIRPKTYINTDLVCFEFLEDHLIKRKKLRGVWSEGIIVKPSDLSIDNYSLGDDVTKYVEPQYDDDDDDIEDGPIDNQDIRHWKEDKFYKNVFSSNKFKNADFATKKEMHRAAKEEAKMIKALRRDAGLGGGCYITTAICEASGKPDDCYELTKLRNFRDNWLAKQPDGLALISEYYKNAPKIVDAINALKNRNSIYAFLNKSFLKKCLNFIKNNQMMDCKKCYMNMVQYCSKFLNKV